MANGNTPQTLWKDILFYALAYLINIAFFSLLALLIFFPPEASELLTAMVSVIGTVTIMVDTYFFGSSKSSSDKNKMIAKQSGIDPIE